MLRGELSDKHYNVIIEVRYFVGGVLLLWLAKHLSLIPIVKSIRKSLPCGIHAVDMTQINNVLLSICVFLIASLFE